MGGAVIFDLDRTLTKRGTWSRFISFANAGRPGSLLATPLIAAQALAYQVGLATRTSVKERSIALFLSKWPREHLENAAEEFAEREVRSGLRPKALSVIEMHRAKGDALTILTAAADLVALPIARRLGIDHVICTRLQWKESGRLCSRLDGANCYGGEKLKRLREHWSADHTYQPVTAYSDHITDLGLLLWADRGVAVNPSRALSRAAKRNGLEIEDWND